MSQPIQRLVEEQLSMSMIRAESDRIEGFIRRVAPTFQRWFGLLLCMVEARRKEPSTRLVNVEVPPRVEITYCGSPRPANILQGFLYWGMGWGDGCGVTVWFHAQYGKWFMRQDLPWAYSRRDGYKDFFVGQYDFTDHRKSDGHMKAMAALRWFMGQSARAQVDALSEGDRFGVAQALCHAEDIAPTSNVYDAIAIAEARRANLACTQLYSADLSAFVDANDSEYRARRARAEELAAEEVAQAVDAIINHMEGLQ